MKRMELTPFYLKLSELKEYDQAKQERQENNKNNAGSSATDKPNTFKWPKTEKEIRERIGIGLNLPDNS